VEASSFGAFHKTELRLWIELSTVVFPAAIETSHRPFDPAHPGELLAAAGATIEKTPGTLPHWKRQGVATRFIRNAEIVAGFSPFGAVGRNAATAGPELGKQMSKLVAQRALDLRGVVIVEAGIQRDEIAARIGAARGAAKAGVPFHVDRGRQFLGVESAQDLASFRFEAGIAAKDDERRGGWKDEVELPVVRLQGAAI
jgi:hypothetical protein